MKRRVVKQVAKPMPRARSRDKHGRDEPERDPSDWVEYGGVLVFAVGFTEGGAPYGLTEDEFDAANEYEERDRGWVRAKRALRAFVAAKAPNATSYIGRVRHIGSGLSRAAYAAEVQVDRVPGLEAGVYVVLLPHRDSDRAVINVRTRREVAVLRALEGREMPCRVPRVAGVLIERDLGLVAIVTPYVRGLPLDLRAGRQTGVSPWKVIARVAAGIHASGTTGLAGVLTRYSTRREHGEAAMAVFDGLGTEVAAARDWMGANLPPREPAALIHGDLLGQNILLAPGEEPTVIDWENAMIGDPAYDLAIVTRGVRQPFQIQNGLQRLLTAYESAAVRPVHAVEVRFHELWLAVRWYVTALETADTDRHGGVRPEDALGRVQRVLRFVASDG